MPLAYKKVDASYLVNEASHYQISLFRDHEMVETWVGRGHDGIEAGLARIVEALSHYRDTSEEVQRRMDHWDARIVESKARLRSALSDGMDIEDDDLLDIASDIREGQKEREALRRALVLTLAWEKIAKGIQKKNLDLSERLSEDLLELVLPRNRYVHTLGGALWALVFDDPERLNGHEVSIYPVKFI